MEKKQNIDDLFRQSLDDNRDAPPAGIWELIERKLDDDEEKPRGFFLRWPWIVLLLIIGLGSAWLIGRSLWKQSYTAAHHTVPIATRQQHIPPSIKNTTIPTEKNYTAQQATDHTHQTSTPHVTHKATEQRQGSMPRKVHNQQGSGHGATHFVQQASVDKADRAMKQARRTRVGDDSHRPQRKSYLSSRLQASSQATMIGTRHKHDRRQGTTSIPILPREHKLQEKGTTSGEDRTTVTTITGTDKAGRNNSISPLTGRTATSTTQKSRIPDAQQNADNHSRSVPPQQPVNPAQLSSATQEQKNTQSTVIGKPVKSSSFTAEPTDSPTTDAGDKEGESSNATSGGPKAPRRSLKRSLSLMPLTGYEQPLERAAPWYIHGGMQLLWHFDPAFSLGIQPVFRWGNMPELRLNAENYFTPGPAQVDSTIDVDGSGNKYYTYTVKQPYDSIVVPAVQAGGTLWNVQLPIILHYQPPGRHWHIYAGPGIGIGGQIRTTTNGIQQSYTRTREQEIRLVNQQLSYEVLADYFGLSRLPQYSSYHAAAFQQNDPAAIHLGYIAGGGYTLHRFVIDISVQQQLTGYNRVYEALRKAYTRPGFRISIGYHLFGTDPRTRNEAERNFMQRL